MRPGKALKKLEAHLWEREANEHYVEPDWCSRRLFEEEDFRPAIWDPCAGFGRIPEEAAKQGLKAHATDIVDRGYFAFDGVQNFLTVEATRAAVIVCNPPFAIASHFAVKALSLEGVERVAMIFPTARLNAAHWLRDTPLARVWLMTPRPSTPPGHVIATGEKPGGGKMDFCWLVWDRAYSGTPAILWLHRDCIDLWTGAHPRPSDY